MAGKKFDSEKLRMDLIPVSAIRGLAAILTHGAKKYGDRNWEEGLAWSRPYAATLRHLFSWYDGEDIDPDSRFPHLFCALCEIAFLIEFEKTHKELDDRPTHPTTPNSTLGSTIEVTSEEMEDKLQAGQASLTHSPLPSKSENHKSHSTSESKLSGPDLSHLNSGCSLSHR